MYIASLHSDTVTLKLSTGYPLPYPTGLLAPACPGLHAVDGQPVDVEDGVAVDEEVVAGGGVPTAGNIVQICKWRQSYTELGTFGIFEYFQQQEMIFLHFLSS